MVGCHDEGQHRQTSVWRCTAYLRNKMILLLCFNVNFYYSYFFISVSSYYSTSVKRVEVPPNDIYFLSFNQTILVQEQIFYHVPRECFIQKMCSYKCLIYNIYLPLEWKDKIN